jgi:hypothetical protein
MLLVRNRIGQFLRHRGDWRIDVPEGIRGMMDPSMIRKRCTFRGSQTDNPLRQEGRAGQFSNRDSDLIAKVKYCASR